MKKAYLVSINYTVRVVVDVDNNGEPDSEVLNAAALAKAIECAPVDMCLENIGSVDDDLECPVDIDDIEFLLFPSLQSLNEDQQIEVEKAWCWQEEERKALEAGKE